MSNYNYIDLRETPLLPAEKTQRLKGKHYLITGATGGLGSVLAIQLAQQGAVVVALARSNKKLDALYDRIMAAGGTEPLMVGMDLLTATPDQYDAFVYSLQQSIPRLDGVVHCAAHFGGLAPLISHDLQDWGKTIQVNLNAPCLITQALLPWLREANPQNMAANAPVVQFMMDCTPAPKAYWGAYSVAKHGLLGFAQVLAAEEDGLQVQVVQCPAMITKLYLEAYPSGNRAITANTVAAHIAQTLF